jgi:hypothetical protein
MANGSINSVDWIVIPHGPTYRRELEVLAGSEFDPGAGKYGLNWSQLRYYRGGSVNGYGYNGIYLDAYLLPDGRVMIQRTDKYSCVSKFRLFATEQDYLVWVKAHNAACPEVDPETGRLFPSR